MAPPHLLQSLAALLWGRRQANAPWQGILKYSIASAIAVALALLPLFNATTAFLIPMVVVFAHPGQRMGLMIESLLMVLFGSLLGLSWSLLGLRLAYLVERYNSAASYTIRALFFLVCLLVHGYVRSASPRLMIFVLFLVIAAVLTVQLPADVTSALYMTIYIPILLGAGALLVVNLAIFPELSSSYLGSSTIDTLSETVDTLTRATHWFVTPGCDPAEYDGHKQGESALNESDSFSHDSSKPDRPAKKASAFTKFFAQFPNPFRTIKNGSALSSLPHQSTKLVHLTEQKPKLRARLARCKAAQDEVNFEISLSPLPPTAMKPISIQFMTGLVRNVTTLIGACENKFVVVGNNDTSGASILGEKEPISGTRSAEPKKKSRKKKSHSDKVDSVKPIKEIETSSAELLESIIARIRGPAQIVQVSLTEAANLVILCLAYCFDVPKLPSGASSPKSISLEELDLRIDRFAHSLTVFDSEAAEQLKRTMMDKSCESVHFMPGMETFLASSFILSFRDSAAQLLAMLRHLRLLVEKRQHRRNRSRLWVPQYARFRQWLARKGPADAVGLAQGADNAPRAERNDGAGVMSGIDQSDLPRPADEESHVVQTIRWAELKEPSSARPATRSRSKPGSQNLDWIGKTRAKAADALEWAQNSKDLDYALKLSVAVFLLLWPAFVTSWRPWYNEVRGIWAPMQLMLVFDISIGSSAFGFVLRLFGVTFGCVAGFLAYEIGRGNRIAIGVILLVGIVPSIYLQVSTKYVKVAMVSIVSMTVVALASVGGNTPAYEVFYKRLVAFLVGGIVAMLVEVVVAPVRARDRLVDSLSASVRQVEKMEASLSVGIDGPGNPDLRSQALLVRFNRARDKAQAALAAAESFLPFCLSEPRLKGSFKPLAPIYAEIIYVLHQIIDRMDNVVQLRRTYGSSILEELNPKVYAYRRNVAASTMLILFSINEALTTWLPLPQFIPSARLALLRLISRVREILVSENTVKGDVGSKAELDEETASLITKRKFLSWNASTAGQMEIIEYLEELVELVKLLVGVNAFRSGMLERPSYSQYVGQGPAANAKTTQAATAAKADEPEPRGDAAAWASLRRTGTAEQTAEKSDGSETESDSESWDEGIPLSLQRVGSRLRRDSSIVRRRTFTAGGR